MDPTKYRQFFQSKLELARFLVQEKGDQAEPDAEILLCCAISGLATILWPGLYIDRQRFVQLLIDFTNYSAGLQLISTPVLASQLQASGDTSSAIILSNRFFPGHHSEEIEPAEADQDESVVAAVINILDSKTIRRASYASIIYTDLRCALIHSYSISPHITTFNLFGDQTKPSYTNMTFEDGHSQRLLHLPFKYLCNILMDIAEAVFTFWESTPQWEKPKPSSWWCDGQ
jgi:hypothetical protein